MNCAKCGRQNPATSSFCGGCGAPLGAVSPAAGAAPVSGMTPVGVGFQPKKNELLPWLIGAGIAFLLALIGMGATGVLRFGKDGNHSLAQNDRFGGSLAAQSQIGASLRQPGDSGANLSAAGDRKEMPQDVYDWLKHLEKCEKMKEDLAAHQMDNLAVSKNRMGAAEGMTQGDVQKLSDPEGNVELPEGLTGAFNMIANMDKDWRKLKDFFDSKPPPEECKPIAEAYDNGLGGLIDTISQAQGVIGAFADPSKVPGDASAEGATSQLHDLSKSHAANVDEQLQITDDLVESICKKYDVMKWFKIDAHGAGLSPMAGLGG